MATTFTLSWGISGASNGTDIDFTRADVTYATSSDLQAAYKVHLYPRTTTDLPGGAVPSSATMVIYVPSVDGNFVWTTSANEGESAAMNWKAGVPLILSTGTATAYDATPANRLSPAGSANLLVYFYNKERVYGEMEILYLL